MSGFRQKLWQIFSKYGMTEPKFSMLLNLYDDILDCYAKDQKEREVDEKIINEDTQELVKLHKECEERKQKLQQIYDLWTEYPIMNEEKVKTMLKDLLKE